MKRITLFLLMVVIFEVDLKNVSFSLPRTLPDFLCFLMKKHQKENSLQNLKLVFVICLGSVLF